VLVVEDETLIRDGMVEILAEAGFEVVQAETGDQAARLIDADGFSLVLTDVNMPGRLTGIELAAHARARNPQIPIVFVTGRPDNMAKLARSGAHTVVIPKPYSPADVVRAVRELISVADH
jgi:DNA-binding response OmpR family regulator